MAAAPLAFLLLLSALDAGMAPVEEPLHVPTTVVTATRAPRRSDEVVVATEVITRKQIEASGAQTVAAVLELSPGVEVEYSFRGVGVRLQGLDPAYVLILLNGERLVGRMGTTLDVSRLPTGDVERIEIIKGPAAALYGSDAMGGVVNIVTRTVQKPLELQARGSLGTRLLADTFGRVGAQKGPISAVVSGGYRTGLSWDRDPATPQTTGPGSSSWDATSELGWAPAPGFRVTGRAGYLRRELDAVDVSDSGAVFDRRGRLETLDLGLGAILQRPSGLRVAVQGGQSLARDQLLQDQRGSRALDAYTRTLDRLYRASADVSVPLPGQVLGVGGDVHSQTLSSERLVGGKQQRVRAGLYLQDEWRMAQGTSARLDLLPGVRVDHDSQFGWAVSPRLALMAVLGTSTRVRLSWGLGFRAPSFQELYLFFENNAVGYIVEGNPSLRPERSHSLTATVDQLLPWEGWSVAASAFHTDVVDLIAVNTQDQPDPDNPARYRYGNVARAVTQGGELSLRARLSRGTYLDLGYSLLDARDLTLARPLQGRATHRGTIGVLARYRPAGLELSVRAGLVGGRVFYRDSDGDGVEDVAHAPAWVDLEATGSYQFATWLKIFVSGTNLLNAGDEVYLPKPPRGVLGGLQLDY